MSVHGNFWHQIERRNQDTGEYEEIANMWLYCPSPITSISGTITGIYNQLDGDTYGWPADNMTPEEFDRLYDKGQRTFVFVSTYREDIVKIRIDSDETMNAHFTKMNQIDEAQKDATKKLNRKIEALEDLKLTMRNVVEGHYEIADLSEALEFWKDTD